MQYTVILLQYKTQEGGKKGIDKRQNNVTKDGIKESDETKYEHIDRCVECQMRKDGANIIRKFLLNYRVLSENVTWGNAEEEQEKDSGKSRGKEKLQPQSTDRANIPYGNLYEM